MKSFESIPNIKCCDIDYIRSHSNDNPAPSTCFSKEEISIMQRIIKGEVITQKNSSLTQMQWKALMIKLGHAPQTEVV